MFIFEKYFSLYAFAIVWGLVITADFVLRMMGLAGFHGIQTGVIFPFIAPVMTGLVIIAFIYFLSSPNRALSKKFYSSCNYLMLVALTSTLIIDFALRFVAFDQTYCRGTHGKGFQACKREHEGAIWTDLLKLAAMIRLMFYSTKVLETYADTTEKSDSVENQESLL